MADFANGLSQTLLLHAWQIVLVMIAVLAITRLVARNRPHIAYMLWVVVLLKCVTPPLWSSPSGVFSWLQPSRFATAGEATVVAGSLTGVKSNAAESPLGSAALRRATADTSTVAAPTSHREKPGRVISPTMLLSLLWMSGVVFALARTTLGWTWCRWKLRRAPAVSYPSLERLLAKLTCRIRLRRRVRLVVTSSQVGPGVFGLLRPTVVLPEALVRDRNLEGLEPILAHELIHVRRGDLLLGLLQVCAKSIWWFFPPVWWVSGMATREAERCCDEEVIGVLGWDPKRYAHVLLEVLELKQTLHAMPAVPGMKPVEVTSQRLERIMQLGDRCRKRAPRWYWAVSVLFAAVVLPGASFIRAADVAAGGSDPSTRDATTAAREPGWTANDSKREGTDTDGKGHSEADLVWIDLSKLVQPQPREYKVDTGDTLGIYIEGVLGSADEPPPIDVQPDSGLPPAIGFPVTVRKNGMLALPLIPPINVRGRTLAQIESVVRQAYTIQHEILRPGKDRIAVTLKKPRTIQVTVMRQDYDSAQPTNQTSLPWADRVTRGYTIDLPAYQNDVLHALAKTGGLPGMTAKKEVKILRADLMDQRQRDEFIRRWYEAEAADATVDGFPDPEHPAIVRIPLRLPDGQTPTFKPEDIMLEDGDIVLIERCARDVFYTGGLLGGGEWPLPRDYDLDVISAMAMVAQGPRTRPQPSPDQNFDSSPTAGRKGSRESQLFILRREPEEGQITISVDLARALRDPRARPLVKSGDILVLVRHSAGDTR